MAANTIEMTDYIYGLVHEKKAIQKDLAILQSAPNDAKLFINDQELSDPTLKPALEKMLIEQVNVILGKLDALEIKFRPE